MTDGSGGFAVGSALDSLPVNSTDRTRVLLRLDEATRNDDASTALALLAVERAVPIRRFFAWPGKRNYEGFWWSSTVRGFVPFESLLEREYLMSADFDPHVVAVAAQPLALLWPRGTAGQKNHVPDFFVRLNNGDGRLVGVRHPDRVACAAAQVNLTRQVCAEIGWQYEIFTGLEPVAEQNMRWLAGYRRDKCAPADDTVTAITRCFADPLPLGLGVYRLSRSTGASKDVVLANVLHLLWRRQLSANLSAPLSLDAEVSA
ncbi:MAG: TnsA-like heteromeric transposase endonuclease subunit [Mycobacterium sp.]